MLKYGSILAAVLILAALVWLIQASEVLREFTSTPEQADPGPDRPNRPAGATPSLREDGITAMAEQADPGLDRPNRPAGTNPSLREDGIAAMETERPPPAQQDPPIKAAPATRPERAVAPRVEGGPANTRHTQAARGGDAEPDRFTDRGEFERPSLLAADQVPIQSPARPLDLEIIGEVQASVDDPGYVNFLEDVLPEHNPDLEVHFEDRKEIEAKSLEANLEDLRLAEDSYVRVYFIKEGTIFHNSLGISLEDSDKLIFPDASSVVSYFKDADTRKDLTSEDAPMLPGDYVDLGLMKEGTLLDLFLIKDGARDPEGPIYGLDKEANHDKVNHVRIHDVVDDQTLIIGFEDLPGGGDRDYNDLVIAVEMIPVQAR